MDLAEQGQFDPSTILCWDALRAFAFAILDALMHSHARMVIHRDIKPANILVAGSTAAPRYILSDFGIAFPKAQLRPDSGVPLAAAGTMAYMAPEQLRGQWRDFGPYTDLFSFGVVLFEVVFGRLPFSGDTRVKVAISQGGGADFSGRPRFALPGGFVPWLHKLLVFDPRARFAWAADAAYRLLALEAPVAAPAIARSGSSSTVALAPTLTMPEEWTLPSRGDAPAQGVSAALHLTGDWPVVRDWRAAYSGDTTPIGLELFGLRRALVVGREQERDLMWGHLLQVIDSGTSSALVVSGEGGVGASRIARWLCERADELAVAAQVRVRRTKGGSALSETLTHLLGLDGLGPSERDRRLSELFADRDVDVELVANIAAGTQLAAADQVEGVRQVLRHFSGARPVVVWVDDAHTDLELLQTVHALIGEPMHALFLLTVRTNGLDDSPHEAARLADLLMHPRTEALALPPLEPSEIGAFIASVMPLLDLDRALVTEHAAGNPLRALQMLEVFARTGHVEPGTIAALWGRRLELSASDTELRALEAAAVLGEEIDIDVWRQHCAAAGFELPTGLVDRFVAERLWNVDDGVLRFEHSSLREAVLAGTEAAELRRLHAVAATIRTQRPDAEAASARHLILSGQLDAGMRRLYHVAYDLLFQFRLPEAESLMRWAERMLEDGEAPTEAMLWLQLHDAAVAVRQERPAVAWARVTPVLTAATSAELWSLAAEAIRIESLLDDRAALSAVSRDNVEDISAMLERARTYAERGADPIVRLQVGYRRARVLLGADRAEEALTCRRRHLRVPCANRATC